MRLSRHQNNTNDWVSGDPCSVLVIARSSVRVCTLHAMGYEDRPGPDAQKLLDQWMEWERGDETPGRVLANLKTGGMPELLQSLLGEPDSDA